MLYVVDLTVKISNNMRLHDLISITESTDSMPLGTAHSLPHAVIIPKMDLYYEFYKFVTNMACHPEMENGDWGDAPMRDVPVAVAYTKQEFDMIRATAKRMGFDVEEVAFKGSKETDDVQKTSPVMQFDQRMFESSDNNARKIGLVKEQFMNLLENKMGELHPDVENTISPTMTIPELINSDTYKQYRYSLALAAARAVANGDIEFDAMSAWNEALTGVAYTEQDMETFRLANKLMGVNGVMLSKSPPTEPDDTNTTSPVMKFDMKLTESQKIRALLNRIK